LGGKKRQTALDCLESCVLDRLFSVTHNNEILEIKNKNVSELPLIIATHHE